MSSQIMNLAKEWKSWHQSAEADDSYLQVKNNNSRLFSSIPETSDLSGNYLDKSNQIHRTILIVTFVALGAIAALSLALVFVPPLFTASAIALTAGSVILGGAGLTLLILTATGVPGKIADHYFHKTKEYRNFQSDTEEYVKFVKEIIDRDDFKLRWNDRTDETLFKVYRLWKKEQTKR
ncbi:MAG: hypothetical protein H7A37_08050 [Chlamydiales bacterium]|nr:hypothetical protein [Chlamydiia bacterium]MCP5508233.1 hypothetical protein [Chlamydiales bacterium]